MSSEKPDRRRSTRMVRGPTAAAPVTPAPLDQFGIRRSSAEFESELGGYLRRRLRLWSIVVVFFAIGLLGASLASALTAGWTVARYFALPSTQVHLGAIAAGLVTYFVLRATAPRTLRTLALVDGFVQVLSIGTCIAIYIFLYDRGVPMMSGTIALFLVGRALVVPSSIGRTLALSVPAAAVFLWIQLAHGYVYAWTETPYPVGSFWQLVVWNQAILWLGIGLAALASKVNFELRVKAHQARSMDQYVLEERLGVGAMGEVYRARHSLLRRPTAIKMIRPDVASAQVRERFEQEVRQTSRLTHPNTIRIYDYGQTADGTFFYAMELLDGADLQRIVDATGPLPPGRAIHVLARACSALAEAHAVGLVHRDVKPGNLILCRQGLDTDVLKVMDFGLVKDVERASELTDAGQVCGSPLTVAPETLKGRAATPAVDVYALGATGYFLLTGQPIFDAATTIEFASKHLSEAPVPPRARTPEVPRDLEQVILSCLEKDPERRPASVLALRDALRTCEHAGTWTPDQAGAWWARHGEGMRIAARAKETA